jgi:hypothetical protein
VAVGGTVAIARISAWSVMSMTTATSATLFCCGPAKSVLMQVPGRAVAYVAGTWTF